VRAVISFWFKRPLGPFILHKNIMAQADACGSVGVAGNSFTLAPHSKTNFL